MSARGATVPLSSGILEMYTFRERSAEKRVGDVEGMRGVREVQVEGRSSLPRLICDAGRWRRLLEFVGE